MLQHNAYKIIIFLNRAMYVYDTCTTFAFCVLRLASSLAHSILMQRHIALAMHAQHFMLAQVPRINSTYRFNTCSAGNKLAQAKRIKVTQQISRGQTMRQIFLLQAVKHFWKLYIVFWMEFQSVEYLSIWNPMSFVRRKGLWVLYATELLDICNKLYLQYDENEMVEKEF